MRPPLIALALLFAILAAGCTGTPPVPTTPTLKPAPARYAVGDLLRGELARAGFDDPNGTPPGAAIVILDYRPVPGEYVYTVVQPVPGGWAFAYPSGDFVATLARDRTTFESYGLEPAGTVDLRDVESPPNGTAPRPS
jgi:hypothetical protein